MSQWFLILMHDGKSSSFKKCIPNMPIIDAGFVDFFLAFIDERVPSGQEVLNRDDSIFFIPRALNPHF